MTGGLYTHPGGVWPHAQHWYVGNVGRAEMLRGALAAHQRTSQEQVLHFHPAGVGCAGHEHERLRAGR